MIIRHPGVLSGGLATDDRGTVGFVNGFDPHVEGVRRFYTVSNHRQGFIRAWHAHKEEAKYVTVLRGSAVVAAVKIEGDWKNPNKGTEVERFVLSANKPSVLYIPEGYANGFMNLTEDAQLMFFSTSTMEETEGDDYRYESDYWDAWEVVER